MRPDAAEEAVVAWTRHADARYLAGGTEITTSARRTAAYDLGACIDIKRIPEANVHETSGGLLRLGAALTLSDIADRNLFPLLSATSRGIADRTVRNRLTLGGNLAGMLPYREAALPLLVTDATVLSILPGQNGTVPVRRERKLRDIFDRRLVLAPGELVLSFTVPATVAQWPWQHQRKTRTGAVDYPLLTACMVRDGKAIRLAIAGSHPYPFRSDKIDTALSRNGLAALPAVLGAFGPLRGDARASAEYRVNLLQNMIRSSLEALA